MSLAFWRRSTAPEFDHAEWCAARLAGARRFHSEMLGWGEPIDVMCAAMGLPERWQRTSQRAWQAILGICAGLPMGPLEFHEVSTVTRTSAYWRGPGRSYDPDAANTGNPVHDEALRIARRGR